MRSTLVSVILFALVHPLAPGVYGAPAVASEHLNSLSARQNPLSGLLATLTGTVQSILNLLGTQSGPSPSQVEQVIQSIVQELQSSINAPTPNGLFLRDVTSSASSTTHSSLAMTTPSAGLVTNTLSNVPSVPLSTPRASSSPPSRMRRQSPTLDPVTANASSLSALLPTRSVPGSTPSATSSNRVTSDPTTGPSQSVGRA